MKVLVLGAGADQIDFVQSLRRICSTVFVADYHTHPPAEPYADKHFRISTLDVDAVERLAKAEAVDGVLTACIDQALLTTAVVCARLGLPFYLDEAAVRAVTHKVLMKERLNALGVPTAVHSVVSPATLAEADKVPLPAVVKPADSNGSLAVRRVTERSEMTPAVRAALAVSRTERVVVEEYLEGDELSVDVFVNDGRAEVLLITQSLKLPGQLGFPIVRSLYPAALTAEQRATVGALVQQIAQGFQIRSGPMIVQMIRSEMGLRVIEFSARIAGGGKHRLIERITGVDVMGEFVNLLFNRTVRIEPRPRVHYAAMSYVYCRSGVVSAIDGLNALAADGTVESYQMNKTAGMKIAGPFGSRERAASYLCIAATRAELDAKLGAAAERIRVLDSDGRNIALRV